MHADPVMFAVVATACILFVAMEKAGFGSGMGVIATPMLTLVTDDPSVAAGILLPLLIVTDWVALWFWWGKGSWQAYRLIMPGILLGIVLASGALWLLLDTYQGDPDTQAWHKGILKQIIGWIALLFVAYQLLRPWLLDHVEHFQPRPWHGWLAGLPTGLASTFAHAGGPPVVIYLLPQKLDRSVYVGTIVAIFATANLVKLLPYAWLGLLQPANLKISLWLLPIVPLGALLGVWCNRHIRQDWFVRGVYTALTFIGLAYVTQWL